MVKTVKFWVENSRWVSLPQSLMPAVVAVALAASHPDFSILLSVLAILGVGMAHLSFNLFDDYFDYKKNKPGIRDTLARAGVRARIGKCTYLTSGEATVNQLLIAALIFGGIAGLFGLGIFAHRGIEILWVVLALMFLGLSYSADPLRLSYRGLGELTIGVIFGPLLIVGVYLAASGTFGLEAVLIGAALGLLVTNILYTHSALDLEADRSVGKLTMAVLAPTWRVPVSAMLMLLPYVIILAGVWFEVLSLWFLLTFLTLPRAIALIMSIADFYRNPQALPVRRWWYGSMQKWDEIKETGLEWFMIRWYLARNLLTAFSFIIILAAILG